MTKVRINKFIADSGICSRRAADEHILRGEVFINGKAAKPGDKVSVDQDKVLFRGKIITNKNKDFEYWAVNKPIGYISTAKDELGRPKVVDIVKSKNRLYPAGRLDENSTGLIILTNDGELTKTLTHPSFKHRKKYSVVCRQIKNYSLALVKSKILEGMYIDGKLMKAENIHKIVKNTNTGLIEIEMELVTGYNRQIRRMCDKIGLEVIELTRTGLANLDLFALGLKSGQYKKIKKEDIL